MVEQLRGATRLAVDATQRVTDIVEAMHREVGAGPAVLGRPFETLTKVSTAPTYGAIRQVTAAVGAGLDFALGRLAPLIQAETANGGALVAALNGVLGDYLASTHNPLAIDMALWAKGAPLALNREALEEVFPQGDKLLVLVHGCAASESSWKRDGHHHGDALERDLGFVPVALRYNSGLHISDNGKAFAAMLERLVDAWPRPVRALVLMGHSMGGLVARAAVLAGEESRLKFRTLLRALVTLGTPHHGASLERGGNWVDAALGSSRFSAPLARLGKLRSAGVTDLRFGNVLEAHWKERDRFARDGDPREEIHLPQGVACFAVAGTTALQVSAKSPGDGLVSVDSALGRHRKPALHLDFGEGHTFVAPSCTHLDLLSRADVYSQLRTWLAAVV